MTVKQQDIQNLGAQEQRVLDLSFRSALSEKRVRNIVWSTLTMLAGVILIALYVMDPLAMTGMALVILMVAAVEKISYAKEILVYKSLVRDLTHRLEDLEGLKPTPSGGHPDEAKDQLANGRNHDSVRA